jgi:hypothetical protein
MGVNKKVGSLMSTNGETKRTNLWKKFYKEYKPVQLSDREKAVLKMVQVAEGQVKKIHSSASKEVIR